MGHLAVPLAGHPARTGCVLAAGSYAPVLRDYDGVLSFVRPVADGHALSVSSGTREVPFSAVPSSTILGKLMESLAGARARPRAGCS